MKFPAGVFDVGATCAEVIGLAKLAAVFVVCVWLMLCVGCAFGIVEDTSVSSWAN